MSGNPTSMIGPCQEGKSSPDALRRSAGVNSFWFFAACVGLSAVVPISDRTRLPCAVADQRVVLHRRLSLCFPASLETNQREHPDLTLLHPVGLTARPGRLRVEKILLVHRHALRSDAVRFQHLKIPLPTVDGHEVGHQLPCHRQRGAIGIAFLFFSVIEHGQFRAVARRHLCCFDQRRPERSLFSVGARLSRGTVVATKLALHRYQGSLPAVRGSSRPCAIAACCSSRLLPSAACRSCFSSAPSAGLAGCGTAACAAARESPSRPRSTPAENRTAGSRKSCSHQCDRSSFSRQRSLAASADALPSTLRHVAAGDRRSSR